MLLGVLLGISLLAERGTSGLVLLGPISAFSIIVFTNHLKTAPRMIWLSAGLLLAAVALAWIIAGRYLLEYLFATAQHNSEMINNPYWAKRTTFDFYIVKGIRWMTDGPWALIILLASILTLALNRVGRKIGIVAFCLFIFFNIEPFGLNSGVSWLYLLIFVAAIIIIGEKLEHRFVIASWIIVPLFIFSLFASRDIQFVYSVMPAVAIGASALLVTLAVNKKAKIVLTIIFSIFFLLSTFQFLAVSFPNKGIRNVYMSLPDFVRFASGNEYFGPEKSSHKEEAEKILDMIGAEKSGVVLFFPGEWPEQIGTCYRPTRYEIGCFRWMLATQVYMDFKNNDFDYIVFSKKASKGLPWADEMGDSIILYSLSAEQLEKFRLSFIEDEYKFINAFMSDSLMEKMISHIDGLPGKEIGNIHLYCGKSIKVRIIGPKTESTNSFSPDLF